MRQRKSRKMMSILRLRLLLSLVLVSQLIARANAAEVDVYLLGGQSNMQGVGKYAELPDPKPKEVPFTWFWNGQSFEPFVAGKTKTSARQDEFGPELGFALEMATEQRPVYLIKYHASGMALHHGWKGNEWAGANHAAGRRNFYPGKHGDAPDQGTLYREMLRRFESGLSALKSRGDTPVVRGFVWMQGEQDSKHELSATTYAANLRHLRQRLTDDLNLGATLPLVFGQVLPHEPPLPRFTHRSELRQQMEAADERSGKNEAILLARMVSTDGYELLPDTVHYNAASQLRLGRAFATTMKELTQSAATQVSGDSPP
jgi:hypothetical protein